MLASGTIYSPQLGVNLRSMSFFVMLFGFSFLLSVDSKPLSPLTAALDIQSRPIPSSPELSTTLSPHQNSSTTKIHKSENSSGDWIVTSIIVFILGTLAFVGAFNDKNGDFSNDRSGLCPYYIFYMTILLFFFVGLPALATADDTCNQAKFPKPFNCSPKQVIPNLSPSGPSFPYLNNKRSNPPTKLTTPETTPTCLSVPVTNSAQSALSAKSSILGFLILPLAAAIGDIQVGPDEIIPKGEVQDFMHIYIILSLIAIILFLALILCCTLKATLRI